MSKQSTTVVRTGVTPLSLLTLLFIALKLTGYISWSWFWVLSPTLIPLGVGGFLMLLGLLIAGAVVVFFPQKKPTRRGRW